MTVFGIICEYNPMHLGHVSHIEKTRHELGCDSAAVCVMSGNFVQRGDFSVFNKHVRAEAAVLCGADLVVELPLPYSLSSAEDFARAGVFLLDKIGADYISFGSESGDITAILRAAEAIVSEDADKELKKWLQTGVSYAKSRQKAAERVLSGKLAALFKTPNNLLAIEYVKAINAQFSKLRPFTVKREGAKHDSLEGSSSSFLRKMLQNGSAPWQYMPIEAARLFKDEITAGRGPVENCETAILARLRALDDSVYSALPGASEGFYNRLMRYCRTEPTVDAILEKAKTKRYVMSRLRRMLLCACLGISETDTRILPPYIRVLAMNETGMKILKNAAGTLPVITKPASAKKLPEQAKKLFYKEAAATDFYVLAYPREDMRAGGTEWTQSPRIVRGNTHGG